MTHSSSRPFDAASSTRPSFPIAGWLLSGLLILFLAMDAGLKIVGLPIVAETVAALGWTPDAGFWRAMGLLLLGITALYAWPRTAVIGTILLTAYFGGAVATHARIGSPLITHTLFGVYLGVIAWAGLWLRDARIRVLLPIG